jgi:hypothetical protein
LQIETGSGGGVRGDEMNGGWRGKKEEMKGGVSLRTLGAKQARQTSFPFCPVSPANPQPGLTFMPVLDYAPLFGKKAKPAGTAGTGGTWT